ncbi:MAG: hypothetical protein HN521_12955 [Candidatus Latescibacteria bacterium]|jgi:hypothetical protein|nr:hypothetical protein [Candidatus Latescibacterota bacterium]MBT5829143.1 hypothetical protein [Candidatus Latescibacterota bacterium]
MNRSHLVGHPKTEADKARLAMLDQASQESEALQEYGTETWRKKIDGFEILSESSGIVYEDGKLVTQYTYDFQSLADGTYVKDGPGLTVKCAFSKALISRSSAVKCQGCHLPIWVHHAKETDEGWVCTKERNRQKMLWPLLFIGEIFRVFFLSLAGKESSKESHGSLFSEFHQRMPYEEQIPERSVAPREIEGSGETLRAWQAGRPVG